MNAAHASIDAMLNRVADRLRNTTPVYDELKMTPRENMAEWRGLHLLRQVLLSGGGWEAMEDSLFHRSDVLGDVFLKVGLSMRSRFEMVDSHVFLRVANDEGTLMCPCVSAQHFGVGVPLSDHITSMVLLGQAGWPLEHLPSTMLPAVATPLLREALLNPSSSEGLVRRIGVALTHEPTGQYGRMRSTVIAARKEMAIRLFEEGALPPAAHASTLWHEEALPRLRKTMRSRGCGDDDVLALLLQGWEGRDTKTWESLSILRAVREVLEEQSPSGRAWLKQAHRGTIDALIVSSHKRATADVW